MRTNRIDVVIAALILAGGGLAVTAVLLVARSLEAQSWRRSLLTYRLTLPRSIDTNQLAALFAALAAITHRPKWSLLPMPPVVIETVATAQGIGHLLRVSRRNSRAVLSSLQATLPGAGLAQLEPDDEGHPSVTRALELTITSRQRPLAIDRTDATATTLLASLQPLASTSCVVVQVVLTSAGTPWPVRQASRGSGSSLHWIIEGEPPVDAEAVGQLRRKFETPLLNVVVRVGVGGGNPANELALVRRTWSGFQALNAPGVRLVRRFLPGRTVARRLTTLSLPLGRWPLLLNSRELVGVAGLPTGPLHLPGLHLGAARQLPAPTALPRRGLVLGLSNFPGQSNRALAISTLDRTRHSWWIGPTGSGKSTLMASAIGQDIAAGNGVFAIDVKGDLIAEVLARIDERDRERVVVIDPTNRDRPVGLNVLAHAGGEASRELAVDNVVHIFREIWKGFWGPRTDMVMRAGLSTLTIARAPDGAAYTLVELSPLLTNPTFRRSLLARTEMPTDLRAFWARYDGMSEGERGQVIGPTLNKLDAFTSRTAIRLLLGQSQGIDLRQVFSQRQVVLVALDKGQLGSETTALLGALIVATLWQATLTRAQVPMDRRRPAFAYIDEAQDIVRLPLAIADMLAQARGYGLGITLANQYASQLPESVRSAILGTVRTQLCFALDYDDARLLQRRFAPLTADDLQGLQTYEVAIRPSVSGQTLTPVTGTTQPLPPPVTDPGQVAKQAAQRHGVVRSKVEAAMAARLTTGPRSRSFGREPRP